jgi:hypothetical protein
MLDLRVTAQLLLLVNLMLLLLLDAMAVACPGLAKSCVCVDAMALSTSCCLEPSLRRLGVGERQLKERSLSAN